MLRDVALTRTADGVELYFPPLRAPGTALGLAVFGALCIAMPLAGLAALAPQAGRSASFLALALLGGFVVPFVLCGIAFIALGAYQAASSLRVRVGRDAILTQRRLPGLTIARRHAAVTDIIAIEPQIPARFQSPFGAEPRYRLVARLSGKTTLLVVAEGLAGEAAMREVKALIEITTGIQPAGGD